MNAILTILAIVLCLFVIFMVPQNVAPFVGDYGTFTILEASKAILLCVVLAAAAGLFAYRQGANSTFLLRVFVAGLLLRVLLGSLIFAFRGQDFFGGDAITYDFFGNCQLLAWGGDRYAAMQVNRFIGTTEASGWGMVYLVAAVYGLIGRNMLAIQLVNAVLGGVTAPIIFLCAQHVFGNLRVSRFAALLVAFYPSLVLWSSQGLKDGPIVFCLTLSILATLKLGE